MWCIKWKWISLSFCCRKNASSKLRVFVWFSFCFCARSFPNLSFGSLKFRFFSLRVSAFDRLNPYKCLFLVEKLQIQMKSIIILNEQWKWKMLISKYARSENTYTCGTETYKLSERKRSFEWKIYCWFASEIWKQTKRNQSAKTTATPQ